MGRFDYFVVFAEMRTGSNFLEANINHFEGLSCHGEAFNPSFIGGPKATDILGIDLATREADPGALISAIKAADGLAGFRFFNNHDPRALEICLADPRCAKIILTRNPVDSFVSWKIAKATGQWKLTNATHAKSKDVVFDPDEFAAHLQAIQDFQVKLLTTLQKSGQTAFYLGYDDLSDLDTMNGLAAFLGCADRLKTLDRKLKKQNPTPAIERVLNPGAMEEALTRLDRFNLHRTPNFEPRRGPMIPAYIAAPQSDLLYLPLRSGLDDAIAEWLAALDDRKKKDTITGFTQKTLRQWKRGHRDHRSFAVLRHPVVRAHQAFCTHILFDGPKILPKIRQTLRRVHKLPIPADPLPPRNLQGYDINAHKTAFLAFLAFLKNNLSAQTSVRVDPAWASQLAVLQGMAQFGLPDVILREDELPAGLGRLAAHAGRDTAPDFVLPDAMEGGLLREIYDPTVEQAAQDAYLRDYVGFGFGDWL
ncbi:nodulation protein NodH [Yoonia sp. SS1-5]|uniref:Nodulation protein NodH n=1 Tax=Yoonia rhodophyticola TaxID=3137370 RepID=A0AAN0MMJ0_9RHOB